MAELKETGKEVKRGVGEDNDYYSAVGSGEISGNQHCLLLEDHDSCSD